MRFPCVVSSRIQMMVKPIMVLPASPIKTFIATTKRTEVK
jgi:hypothetical protein